MAQLSYKIKAYLEANGKNHEEEINKTFEIWNEGDGDKIGFWKVSGVAQPTQEQLDAIDSTATTLEANNRVFKARKRSYGNWKEQLDKLYHDIDGGKLDKDGTWYKHIKAVKDANAKE